MGKLIVVCGMTLDGFYEGPGQDVTALGLDAPFYRNNLERIRSADTVLLGGKSYDGFKDFWPARADDPDAPDFDREFARIYNGRRKVVVSDTAAPPPAGHPWAGTTTITPRSGADARVADLRRDGEVVMWASRRLWHHLLAQGLVDELQLFVAATLLGDGTPALPGSQTTPTLVDLRRFDGSDSVLLTYAMRP